MRPVESFQGFQSDRRVRSNKSPFDGLSVRNLPRLPLPVEWQVWMGELLTYWREVADIRLIALFEKAEEPNVFHSYAVSNTHESCDVKATLPADSLRFGTPMAAEQLAEPLRLFPSLTSLIGKNQVQSFHLILLENGRKLPCIIMVGYSVLSGANEPSAALLSNICRHIGEASASNAFLQAYERCAYEGEQAANIQRILNALLGASSLAELVNDLFRTLNETFGTDYVHLLLYCDANDVMLWEGFGFTNSWITHRALKEPMFGTPTYASLVRNGPWLYNRSDIEVSAGELPTVRSVFQAGIQAGFAAPLTARGQRLGFLGVWSTDEDKFRPNVLDVLNAVLGPVSAAVQNALAHEASLRSSQEKEVLRGEEGKDGRFAELLGKSPAHLAVLEKVEVVSDSEASVLILGETGTGKELVARAIHLASGRREKRFIKINCAAIPAELLESELFGHEKGAFTGANNTKTGLIELANNGTLFLDEIGDMPLSLQPKLLRVLQERQLTRVGGTRSISVDFRLIAATHQDLPGMISSGKFRSDLYYRLNVFPIKLPALRDRREDISVLVGHFVKAYAKHHKRAIDAVPQELMEALLDYDWPGNIRELENSIERAVVLSKGTQLSSAIVCDLDKHTRLEKLDSQPDFREPSGRELNFEEAGSRTQILDALRECRGVVAGPKGAAARLGVKRTTLLWRMQRLGIHTKREFR